jgi:hypothetical protein
MQKITESQGRISLLSLVELKILQVARQFFHVVLFCSNSSASVTVSVARYFFPFSVGETS